MIPIIISKEDINKGKYPGPIVALVPIGNRREKNKKKEPIDINNNPQSKFFNRFIVLILFFDRGRFRQQLPMDQMKISCHLSLISRVFCFR